MNKKIKRFLPIILFVLGILTISYPLVSQKFYEISANEQIQDYRKNVESIDPKVIEEKLRLARIFNETIDNTNIKDPYTDSEKKKAKAEYARMLEVNERLGFVEIPKINQNLMVYAGTNENVLQKGVGHLEGTSLPVGGKNTHTVLTAHRGLPTAALFTELDKMEKGDVFYIHTLNEVFAYKVDSISVVEPSDFSKVLIVPDKDYATLLTCTPYMINSHRLLVRGERIEYTAPIDEELISINRAKNDFQFYLYLSLFVIFMLLVFIFFNRKRIKELRKRYVTNEEE